MRVHAAGQDFVAEEVCFETQVRAESVRRVLRGRSWVVAQSGRAPRKSAGGDLRSTNATWVSSRNYGQQAVAEGGQCSKLRAGADSLHIRGERQCARKTPGGGDRQAARLTHSMAGRQPRMCVCVKLEKQGRVRRTSGGQNSRTEGRQLGLVI